MQHTFIHLRQYNIAPLPEKSLTIISIKEENTQDNRDIQKVENIDEDKGTAS